MNFSFGRDITKKVVHVMHHAPRIIMPFTYGACTDKVLLLLLVGSVILTLFCQITRASTPGAVLVLGATKTDSLYIAGNYGSGFIVKIDTDINAAYVLTAKHIAAESDRLFILYDPIRFPINLYTDRQHDTIPTPLTEALDARGHPVPTFIRQGQLTRGRETAQKNVVYFQTESLILSGRGREYLVVPQTEHLELFHLLPATIIRQSDSEIDLALLVVNNFPEYDDMPVLFMDMPDSIPVGSMVTASGCNCGPFEGLSYVETQVEISFLEQDHLGYTSAFVHPSFAGGPVMFDGHVMAVSHSPYSNARNVFKAQFSSEIKDLVDTWIGLPRMIIDLEIASPLGARDGTVSTGQRFQMRAAARLDPVGEILAPSAMVELELPDAFTTQDPISHHLSVEGTTTWSVCAPQHMTEPKLLRLNARSHSMQTIPVSIAEIPVETEASASLKGLWVDGPPNGAKIFLNDEFPLVLRIQESGSKIPHLTGKVSLHYPQNQFEIVDGPAARPITVGQDIHWILKALDIARHGSITSEMTLETLDRNDSPIQVSEPSAIHLDVIREWRSRFHLGLGRIGLNEASGFEIEFGAGFRVANLLHRGFPVRYGFSFGAGLDRIDSEIVSSEFLRDEVGIIDWRYWASFGMSAGLGALGLGFDLGHLTIRRNLVSEHPQDIIAHLERGNISSLYVQPGVELSLVPEFRIYIGSRFLANADLNEIFLQIRFCNGK